MDYRSNDIIMSGQNTSRCLTIDYAGCGLLYGQRLKFQKHII